MPAACHVTQGFRISGEKLKMVSKKEDGDMDSPKADAPPFLTATQLESFCRAV